MIEFAKEESKSSDSRLFKQVGSLVSNLLLWGKYMQLHKEAILSK